MSLQEQLAGGDLEGAIAATVDEVKGKPTDSGARYRLFALLVFAGDLHRARKQLEALDLGDPELLRAKAVYINLLAAEQEPGGLHLLATDVVLPGMNGRELFERLQALHPGLKCLYLSGYTADAITQRGVLPEGVNFLQKPFALKTLAEKVRAVLDAAE